MTGHIRVLAILLGLIVWRANPVFAAPITFIFEGDVLSDPLNPGGFAAPFFGSYTFESTLSDTDPSANLGLYTTVGGVMAVNVGGTLFTTSDFLFIQELNAPPGSPWDFYTITGDGGGLQMRLNFADADGTALTGTALLTDAPSLPQFENATFSFSGFGGIPLFDNGVVTGLACVRGCVSGGDTGADPVPVPEPTTLTLVTLGGRRIIRSRRRMLRRSGRLVRRHHTSEVAPS